MDAEADERPASVPQPVTALAAPAPLWAPAGRYGEARRFNLPAATITLLLHIVLITAFFTVKNHIAHRHEAKLTVLNVAPPPPPPPAAHEPPKPEKMVVPPVVTLQAVVTLPSRSALVVPTVPEPAPLPVAAVPSPAPPAPPSIVQASDLGTRMIAGKPPHYPIESRRKKEQGTVVLSLILGVDGAVSAISVAQSSGFSRLDGAALDAVRRWRWEPTLRGGQPVMVRGVVEIPFVLKG